VKVLSFPQLESAKGIRYSRRHVRRLELANEFPKSIALSPSTIGWIEAEVDAWLADKVAQRDDGTAPRLPHVGIAVKVAPAQSSEYLLALPDVIPRGRVLVHNNLRPTRRLGWRGFRAWLSPPGDQLSVCACGWAPELGQHFIVLDDARGDSQRNVAPARSPRARTRENPGADQGPASGS
jgi:prophage regulatory protein